MLGHARHHVQRFPHGPALRDERAGGRGGVELCSECRDGAAELLPLLGLAEGEHDLVRAERLGEVVVGALFHGGERRLFAPVRAHHDDQRRAAALAVCTQEGDPAQLGHAHVAQDQVERLGERTVEGLLPIALCRDLVARIGEQQPEGLAEAGFVVHDEDPAHGKCGVRSAAQCGVRNAECGVDVGGRAARRSPLHSALRTPHSALTITPHSALEITSSPPGRRA